MSEILIYCDGASRNNGKENSIGGWGAILIYGTHKKEIYGAEIGATNNQMELTGMIKSLECIKTTNIPIKIMCDSAYVVNGINQWVNSWKKRGWKKGDGKTPENIELWKRLDELVSMQKDVKIIKVRGHADNDGNNRADELANIAMDEVDT